VWVLVVYNVCVCVYVWEYKLIYLSLFVKDPHCSSISSSIDLPLNLMDLS